MMALGLFWLLASLARDMTVANIVSSAMMLSVLCMGGFLVPKVHYGTIGENILHLHDIPTDANWYWIGAGVLFAYAIFFNGMVTVALAFLNPPKKAKAIVPLDNASEDKPSDKIVDQESKQEMVSKSEGKSGGMILPFQPWFIIYLVTRICFDADTKGRILLPILVLHWFEETG